MDEKYYIFVGCAEGQFETEKHEERPYANMYVISPVSTYTSDDYRAKGFKAEKLKCLNAAVRLVRAPGELCTLYFDGNGSVMLAASKSEMISLEL